MSLASGLSDGSPEAKSPNLVGTPNFLTLGGCLGNDILRTLLTKIPFIAVASKAKPDNHKRSWNKEKQQ